MDLKKTPKEYIVKPVIYTGLAVSLALGCKGCEKKAEDRTNKTPTKYEFDSFGECATNKERRYSTSAIATADFDGDGDQDIAILYDWSGGRVGRVEIYENKIPQKGK